MKKILSIILFSFFITNFSYANNSACGIEELKQGTACGTEVQKHKKPEKKEEFINDIENMMKTIEDKKK